MEKEALLAGALDTAIVFEDDHCSVIRSGVSKRVDGYLYSQITIVKPELKLISYTTEDELKEKLFQEKIQQRALSQALELMDNSFSQTYRQKISGRLIEQLEVHKGLLDFLKNRLYSTVLPSKFDPNIASVMVKGRYSQLEDIFQDLREKSRMFGRFSTVFTLELQASDEEQTQIDEVLSDHSAYANFALALYQGSKTLYNIAVKLSLQHSAQFPVLTKRLFETVESQLAVNYKIILKREEFYNPLSSSVLFNQCSNRFYGSPLKAMSAFYRDKYPFSPVHMATLFARQLNYWQHKQESYNEYRCRIVDQTFDELDFLKNIDVFGHHASKHLFVNLDLQGYLSSPDLFHEISGSYPLIQAKVYQLYAAVLFADSLLLGEQYQDALLIYEDVVREITPDRRRNSFWGDWAVSFSSTIKLMWIYEKIEDRNKLAYWAIVARKLVNKYAESEDKEDDLFIIKGSAASLAERVNSLSSDL
jgi:hypothetical protein